MKVKMKRIMGLFLALAVSIGCLSLNPIASYADDADAKTFNINQGSVNITQNGTYTIEGTGQPTSNTINVTGSNIKAKIILNNVNIYEYNQSWQYAFRAKNADQSNVHLTIILEGTNSLKSGASWAGLTWNNSDNNSTLEIKGDGSLTATGGQYGAGIGGGDEGSGENITITGGTVTAIGGQLGAGIGGGEGSRRDGHVGSGENITIAGGTVTATGGENGAGIGGGWYGSGKNITITGGTVTATGGISGAGIGGGVQSPGENITIAGGTVTVTGGWDAAGIGSGAYNGSGKNIKITGGTVKASSISTTPTDGSSNSVYLAKLENQDSVNEVTVYSRTGNAKTFTRAGSHPGGDTAFYLYLTGEDHDLVTSKGKYKAEWTTNAFTVKAKYKVTYKDGADGKYFANHVIPDILSGTTTPTYTPTATRQGYVFAGWSPDVAEKVTANVTYKATWKEDKNHNNRADEDEDKYTVTYVDGVDGQVIFPDKVTSGILSGTDTPKFNGTPTREGYVFAGWNPTFAAKVTADAIYVAQWKKDHFTVTFKDGDKTQTVKVKNGKAIDTDELIDQSMPKNPTKAGYTFKEWNTKEDGKGEKFTGESVVNGDMTVYAIYTKDSVPTLSPLPNGDGSGMNDDAPTTVDKGELNIQIDSAESDSNPGYAGAGAAVKQAADALDEALAQAKRVADNPNATQAQVDAVVRKLADARKALTDALKSQPKKHIGMIPKTGESASFAGLPAAPASAATAATPAAGSASATKSEESKNTSNDSVKDENQKESEDSKNEDSKDEDSKNEDSKSEDAKSSDKSAQASGANNGEHAAGNNITLIAAVAGSITAGIAVLGFSIARLAILRKKKMMEESK